MTAHSGSRLRTEVLDLDTIDKPTPLRKAVHAGKADMLIALKAGALTILGMACDAYSEFAQQYVAMVTTET